MAARKKIKELRYNRFVYLNLELKRILSGETSTRCINIKIVPAPKLNDFLEDAGYQ